ncbi:nucleobase-ascorbate transporter 6-like [Rosa chinensis]|uniref:nucleobase-ascorbate transporter 6-like n=1 Tax=Rosa chinensis TaxID=74649 RepID=UPI001AD8E578|nr:nucleobase-ascorbate transporter 6-like [Rosa chinensis]
MRQPAAVNVEADLEAAAQYPRGHPPRESLWATIQPPLTCPFPPPGCGATTILMAFQHTVVMLGQLVMIVSLLVPLMGGGEEEKAKIILISLFISGWTTLMQCLLGTLLPSVMASSSYAYFIPSMAIAERFAHEDPSKPDHEDFTGCTHDGIPFSAGDCLTWGCSVREEAQPFDYYSIGYLIGIWVLLIRLPPDTIML